MGIYDELEKQSSLSHGTLQRIIHEELEMKKVCARWVPREQRQSHHDLYVINLNELEELKDNFGIKSSQLMRLLFLTLCPRPNTSAYSG